MLDPSHGDLDTALRAVLAAGLSAWLLWWAIALLVALVDRRVAARLGPPLLRTVLVGGVLAATAAPAHAERGSPVGLLDGLVLPERPLTGAVPDPVVAPPPADRTVPRGAVHVVRPGDTLWAIARERDPRASDATIAAAVARWHTANDDVIGPDPDLIQPGQRLVPPGAP